MTHTIYGIIIKEISIAKITANSIDSGSLDAAGKARLREKLDAFVKTAA